MAQRFVMEMKEKSVYKRYPIIASVVDKLAVIVDKVFAIQERLYDDMRTSKNNDRFFLKEASEFINYQGEGYQIKRSAWNDRVFPLETVRLQSYGQTHDADLSGAIIHTGMSADEYARSFNALAITIGRNIFFRNGAYKPETEEGRKVLAHELTHIAQYEEGRITKNIARKELEEEAESREGTEAYEPDRRSEVEIGGEVFLLSRSEQREVIADAIEETVRWFEMQKVILDEKEYFHLISTYAAWKEGRIL